MSIKHTVLRTSDGHATDPLRPDSRVREGVSGYFEVLAEGKSDRFRVSVNGVECEGTPPKWPSATQPGKAAVTFEQIVNDVVKDTKTGDVMVGEPSEPAETADRPDAHKHKRKATEADVPSA